MNERVACPSVVVYAELSPDGQKPRPTLDYPGWRSGRNGD
jgi:hypothetical protein